MAALVGRILGDYIFREKIGGGGYGDVYRAEHRLLKQVVVVKVLNEKPQRSHDAKVRFSSSKPLWRLVFRHTGAIVVIALVAARLHGEVFYLDGWERVRRVAEEPARRGDRLYPVCLCARQLCSRRRRAQ